MSSLISSSKYNNINDNKSLLEKKFSDRLSRIRLVITDVDGVLTDGGMYYTSKGDTMKRFHVLDGMGVNMLRRREIPTIIITKEKNSTIRKWSTKMRVTRIYDGIIKKEEMLETICNEFKVKPEEVAFIGDDINDLGLLSKVGLAASPNNARKYVKEKCHYVCENNGGHGAFRELADMILSQKFNTKNWENYY